MHNATNSYNKRDLMLSLIDDASAPPPIIPAAFFLHFPPEFHAGAASVQKHLEFFRATGMDFVKIQYERTFPKIPTIQQPDDWRTMPVYDREFFAGQLAAIKGLVEAAKSEAVVVVTLYSPFMCAGHTTSSALVTQHMQQDPDAVRAGLDAITASLLLFVRECIQLGVDGFYHSTQGGEAGRFPDLSPAEARGLFEQVIKPADLAVMNEVNATSPFNILHVCDYVRDYVRDYDDFGPFVDYPGDIVNAPLTLHTAAGPQTLTPGEVAAQFGRPFMGGLARKGVIATGTPGEVAEAARAVCQTAPDRFVLAADCTVPSETPWANLKAAIDAAHAFRAGG